MENCIFCKIINREIKSDILYEDSNMIVIKDLQPKAKIHLLVIPKEHYSGFDKMTEKQSAVLGEIFAAIPKLTDKLGLSGGYRIIVNQGENAGQTVMHLHLHLLGGQSMKFEILG